MIACETANVSVRSRVIMRHAPFDVYSRSDAELERGKYYCQLDRVSYQFRPSLFIDPDHPIVLLPV